MLLELPGEGIANDVIINGWVFVGALALVAAWVFVQTFWKPSRRRVRRLEAQVAELRGQLAGLLPPDRVDQVAEEPGREGDHHRDDSG